MREVYSKQLAYAAGVLTILATAVFALIQSPEVRSGPEKVFSTIPHPLERHEQCETCHGLRGDRPYPVRHLGWSRESCTKCHRPFRATTSAAEAGARAAPRNPHPAQGWEDCVSCHAVNSKVRPAPPDHQGRTNGVCDLCHLRKDDR